MASYMKVNELIQVLRERNDNPSYAVGYLSSMIVERFTDEDIDSSIEHIINMMNKEKAMA